MNSDALAAIRVSDQEHWLPVVGHEGVYEVSNHGRVRSLDRYIWRRPSRRHPDPPGWQQFRRGQMLNPTIGSHGYPVFSTKAGPVLLHRAMLEAFVGPCPPGHESLHDDDCKTNNTFPNIRWGTRSQNVRDAIRNGGRTYRRTPMGECMIKVRMKGSLRYSFLTSKGGTNSLRIHAARFPDKDGETGEDRAQRVIDANAADNPGWEWKVVKA